MNARSKSASVQLVCLVALTVIGAPTQGQQAAITVVNPTFCNMQPDVHYYRSLPYWGIGFTNIPPGGSQWQTGPGGYSYYLVQDCGSGQFVVEEVDIGIHYVAVDGNGKPVDTDGDGAPDYQEDANGNGAVDSGETDWQSATDLGLKVLITRPMNNSILP